LGHNSIAQSLVPVAVRALDTPLSASSYRLYENSGVTTPGAPLAGIDSSAELTSVGSQFRLRQGINNGKGFTNISAGGTHTCAVADGAAYCWGLGSSGQLGHNATTNTSVPVAVDTTGAL